jgi:flagellar hook-associated protein 1 FlgK
VSSVATSTRQADISRNAQAAVLKQAQDTRESISGVNLDEEAANMVRFQQAYQAAARVIAVADTLFQTLLSAVAR